MSLTQNGIAAVATSIVVLGLSYLVQSDAGTETASVRKATQVAKSTVNESVMMTQNASGMAVFGMPSVAIAPAPHSGNVETVGSMAAQLSEARIPRQQFVMASPFDECETALEMSLQPVATVELTISAPCHRRSDFVIWHERMAFSGRTDRSGHAVIHTPALAREATFTVTFDNIQEARGTVIIPDIRAYDRAVLQWRGDQNLNLHTLEFGASVGYPGHIWSAATQSPALAQENDQGFIMRLGNENVDIQYWAEVHTFPTGVLNRDGKVSLQVGAIVTEESCGRDLDALGIQTNAGRLLISQEMEIPMPLCDTGQTSVMHDGLFNDLNLLNN